MGFESERARAQVKGILDVHAFPGMAALYDRSGNVIAKAGAALRKPSGLMVVNIGEGYRLCIQRASATMLRERVDRCCQLLQRLLTTSED